MYTVVLYFFNKELKRFDLQRAWEVHQARAQLTIDFLSNRLMEFDYCRYRVENSDKELVFEYYSYMDVFFNA